MNPYKLRVERSKRLREELRKSGCTRKYLHERVSEVLAETGQSPLTYEAVRLYFDDDPEKASLKPRQEVVQVLAEVFGVDIEYLLVESDERGGADDSSGDDHDRQKRIIWDSFKREAALGIQRQWPAFRRLPEPTRQLLVEVAFQLQRFWHTSLSARNRNATLEEAARAVGRALATPIRETGSRAPIEDYALLQVVALRALCSDETLLYEMR